MSLQGQVALITGAGRGIGRGIAERLASDGATLALVDKNAENLGRTAEQIRTAGTEVLAFEADVTDAPRARHIVDETAETFGRLDILVNNAGYSVARPFLSLDTELWRSQVDINLSAAFYFAHPCAHVMKRQGYGRVILIGSACGVQGPIDQSAYGAAKAGVYGLMRAMALELGEYGITTNAIAPGPISTELMRQNLTGEMLDYAPLRVPTGRIGEVEDVAQAVSFLASPQSGFINGATIAVDGGFTAGGGFMVEVVRRRLAAKR